MAENFPATKRFSAAGLALGGAFLLAATAVGVAVFRPGEDEEAPAANAVGAPAPAPSLDDSIAALRERLRADPDNDRDWHLLGLALRDGRDFAGAEQAFRRAMELAPRNPDHAAYLGEMLLLLGGDTPPDEARLLFRRVLELAPGHPQARYYLATLDDMAGRHNEAVDALVALLRDAPADAPWEPQVRDAAMLIARRHGIDLAGRLPPPRAPAASVATAAIPGPTREQMEAARAIPPGEQDAMVRAMVDRLAARLRQDPRDADGWIRLMRSRMVLGERDAARDALRSALAAFPADPATQARLRTAATELGVPGA